MKVLFCSRTRPARLRDQKGQAMVLGIAFMAVLILVLWGVFSISRLVSGKTKLLNAADAAAYSGALVQARALNFQSYINLAQVGHQMAMAHLVTLGSWSDFAATESGQMLKNNPPSYVIAMHFGAEHGKAYTMAAPAVALKAMALNFGELSQAYASHDRTVHQVLASVSDAINSSLNESRDRAIEAVLQENYPRLDIVTKSATSGLPSYDSRPDLSDNDTKGLTNPSRTVAWQVRDLGDQLTQVFKPVGNYRSLILEVSDVYKFLDERNHTKKSSYPVSMRCPDLRHELRRRGQTYLDDNGVWQSIDTQSYHALRSNPWVGCYYREYPMGWGYVLPKSSQVMDGLEYVDEPPENFSSSSFWRWVRSKTQWDLLAALQNPLANSYGMVNRRAWKGGGMAPYTDVRDALKQSRLGFELSLTQYDLYGHTVTVNSRAESFFERFEPRKDGLYETANLFHPYWLAHLISLHQEESE